MILTRKEATTRVARGAALLDAYDLKWMEKINPNILDLASGQHCVLGQVLGDYDWYGALPGMNDVSARVSHGFSMGCEDPAGYSLLTETWPTLIRERRNEPPIVKWRHRTFVEAS